MSLVFYFVFVLGETSGPEATFCYLIVIFPTHHLGNVVAFTIMIVALVFFARKSIGREAIKIGTSQATMKVIIFPPIFLSKIKISLRYVLSPKKY